MKCYYEVLGVAQNANDDELKKSYRKRALQWHPDKNPNNLEEAKVQFQLIQSAYETLSDPQERAFYDRNRESILRGKASANESKPDNLDLFAYFSSQCYSGFDDSERGFYTVYRQIFEKIAAKDMQYMDDEEEIIIPNFGNSDTDLEDVAQFYGYWGAYCTSMSFAWVDEYDIREAQRMGRWVERKIGMENKKVRQKARKQFNEEVRSLVAYAKRRDKRWEARRKMLQEKAAEKAEKQKAAQIRKLEERQRRLQQNVEKERSKMEAYEVELQALEKQFADEWGLDDSEESEEFEETEISCELGGKIEDGVDIDGQEDDEEEDLEYLLDELYCVACNKDFKTFNAMESHNRSKKHRENLAKMKATILAEEEMINADPDNEEDADDISEGEIVNEDPKDEMVNENQDLLIDDGKTPDETDEEELSVTASKKKKKKKKNLPVEIMASPVLESSGKGKKKKNKRQSVLEFDESSDESHETNQMLNGDLEENKKESDDLNIKTDPDVSQTDNKEETTQEKPKLKGKKAKEARKQARQAEASTANVDKKDTSCSVCGSEFSSRTKLFEHIKAKGHAALKSVGGKGKGKSKK